MLAGFVLTFSTAVQVQAQPTPPPAPGGGTPTPYSLADVNNNNTMAITNGNFVFSSFSAVEIGKILGLANNRIATVNNSGIEFQDSLWNVPAGTNYDLSLSFIVSTLDGSPITGVGATLDAANFSNAGSISLAETISTVGPGGLAGNSIAALALFVGGTQSTNITFLPGYEALYITKDFNLNDQDATTGYLFGSDIIQTFVTTTPEPSTYAMLGSGLAGLGFMLRRRSGK